MSIRKRADEQWIKVINGLGDEEKKIPEMVGMIAELVILERAASIEKDRVVAEDAE